MKTSHFGKNQNRRNLELLYISSMTIAFTTRYGDIQVGYKLQIIIGLLWILIGLWKIEKNKFKFVGIYKNDFPKIFKLSLFSFSFF